MRKQSKFHFKSHSGGVEISGDESTVKILEEILGAAGVELDEEARTWDERSIPDMLVFTEAEAAALKKLGSEAGNLTTDPGGLGRVLINAQMSGFGG